MKFNLRIAMWSTATFFAVTFSLCVAYGLVVPPEYHAKTLLEMVLPGFHWISFGSFCLGLVETFLYGGYAGLLFGMIHNFYVNRFQIKQAPAG